MTIVQHVIILTIIINIIITNNIKIYYSLFGVSCRDSMSLILFVS